MSAREQSEGAPTTACRAPETNLYLFANGDVGPCCRNRTLGNIRDSSLTEIWRGRDRAALVERLRRSDFPRSCATCELEHDMEGPESSFTAQFEELAESGADTGQEWPKRMEFELSNRCNLQCVQCNGELSSAIRSRREHRAAMPRSYGKQFFEELPDFLVHLDTATFVGGEPFLAPECFEVWGLMSRVAPDLVPVIVTNGTQWNERVRSVLDSLRVRPYVSMDGITPETFESTRVGASFETVLANLERFRAASERAGTTTSIVFCVMPTNVHELPELLAFAEDRGIYVTTSVVREPAHHAVPNLSPRDLRAIVEALEERDAEMEERLELNRGVWRTELARLRSWSERSGHAGWREVGPKLLMFDRAGDGPTSPEVVAQELAGSGRRLWRLTVGTNGRILDGHEVAAAFRRDAREFEGAPLSVLQTVLTSYEVTCEAEDRYEASFDSVSGPGRLVAVPERDGSGWADTLGVFVVLDTEKTRVPRG